MNHDSCEMERVDDEVAVRAGAPGSYCIVGAEENGEKFQRLWTKLPHGEVGGFALEPAPSTIPGVWPWNGSASQPTLHRRIRLTGRWFGRIEAGRMVSDPAPESIAGLAGSAGPLPLPLPSAAPARPAGPVGRLGAAVRRILRSH